MGKIGNLPLLILFLIFIILNVLALIKILKNEKGLRLLLSVVIVFIFPFIGSIAYVIYHHLGKRKAISH